jgi:methionine aminotransferase
MELAALTRDTDIVVLADEVYEHIVFDAAHHQSVASHPELAARSIVVSSFGKTYHITGWKIGYVLAASALMAEFRKVHQFNVFTVNTPCQLGSPSTCATPRATSAWRRSTRHKREFFREQLRASRFELLPAAAPIFNWRVTARSPTCLTASLPTG